MEVILSWLVTNFGHYGVFILILIFLLIKYDRKFLYKLYKYFGMSKKGMQPKDILKSKISYWVNFKIPNIHIEDECRRKIFIDLLTIRFKSIERNIERIERIPKFESLDSTELYDNFTACISEVGKEFRDECTRNNIPDIVADKYTQWTERTMNYLLLSAQMVMSSNIYDNNYEKMQAIYMLITSMLEITIAEAERSLHQLNGELSGLEYRGMTCE